MSEYIDVEDLPGKPGRYPAHPYAMWARDIPAGKALAIDIDGKNSYAYQQTFNDYFKKHPELGLRATSREGTVYVVKEAPA